MRHAVLCLTLLGALAAAFSPSARAEQQPAAYWNDLARYLAGMPVDAGGPFHKLTLTDQYREHRTKMDGYWERVEKENVAHIIPWRNAHIQPVFNRGTVFYPLCGGDFVNMYTFYPEATRYIMVSAEPAGKIPEPLRLTDSQAASGLRSIRGCIWSIASVNYFVTKAMRSEMKNPYLGGTLPVYLVFAARLNLKVTGIQPVGLGKDGTITALDARGTIAGERPVVEGNRITFTAPGSRTQREIIYLGMRLAGNSADPNTPQGKFLNSLSGLNVLIKSAIYLFHREPFRDLAAFILGRTNVLIQDDSGIPYRYMDRNAFAISFYGSFDTPVRLVEIPQPPGQPDLAKEFKEKSQPLPFRFGYGVLRRDKTSNLLLAVRKRAR
ncbi:MAG: hypothetical protein KBA61_19610 [Spirochaetes bacterium]|nr:hypothetical protein [Spirochaetota bacterium]